jgi:Holliday junction resolvase|tara:strand:- start:340 stop:615 length:276 start_codon:yes stop_codon:yes gene_type:complete
MLTAETRTATANLNAKLNFNIKLTVQEKLLLLSALRDNINKQLEFAETFHGEHYAASSFENIGKLIRIEKALTLTHPKEEVTSNKKFDLFN